MDMIRVNMDINYPYFTNKSNNKVNKNDNDNNNDNNANNNSLKLLINLRCDVNIYKQIIPVKKARNFFNCACIFLDSG